MPTSRWSNPLASQPANQPNGQTKAKAAYRSPIHSLTQQAFNQPDKQKGKQKGKQKAQTQIERKGREFNMAQNDTTTTTAPNIMAAPPPKLTHAGELMAAGHPYRPATGCGIQWEVAQGEPVITVTLWDKGQKLAQAHPLKARTPYEFWYNLEFTQVFPQVKRWWFGSLWTGRVRFSNPVVELSDTDAKGIMGFMQFVDEQTEGQAWSISDTTPVEVFVSLPPLSPNPDNLPLRWRLAELALGIISGDTLTDQWYIVTSLVTPAQLTSLLWLPPNSTTAAHEAAPAPVLTATAPVSIATTEGWGGDGGWCLEGQNDTRVATFCTLLGLKEEPARLAA
jgi:hypothetical protein